MTGLPDTLGLDLQAQVHTIQYPLDALSLMRMPGGLTHTSDHGYTRKLRQVELCSVPARDN